MIDKIKVVAFCSQTSKNPLSEMPQYMAEELGGSCQYFSTPIFKAWRIVLFHASDIHVLVVDDERKSNCRLCKWYHWLNPVGKSVTFSKIEKLLYNEKQYSTDWTEEDFRLWVNRVLLPQIGFKPLAEIWES